MTKLSPSIINSLRSIYPGDALLTGAEETAIDSFPLPVRCGIALARLGAHFAAKTGADEMVLGEEALQVFARRAYVTHDSPRQRLTAL